MTPQDIEAAIGTLPDKLSDLLEVALDDFEKVTKHPKVVVDMGEWCSPYNGKCYVCLAGSVVAGRVGVESVLDADREIVGYLSSDIERKLSALNELRRGNIGEAFLELYSDGCDDDCEPYLPVGCPSKVEVKHSNGSEGFIPEMRSLIALLRTHHL